MSQLVGHKCIDCLGEMFVAGIRAFYPAPDPSYLDFKRTKPGANV